MFCFCVVVLFVVQFCSFCFIAFLFICFFALKQRTCVIANGRMEQNMYHCAGQTCGANLRIQQRRFTREKIACAEAHFTKPSFGKPSCAEPSCTTLLCRNCGRLLCAMCFHDRALFFVRPGKELVAVGKFLFFFCGWRSAWAIPPLCPARL